MLVLGLALYVARYSWEIPLAADVERELYDRRFHAEAERVTVQDDRIVLITYNDDTLEQLGKRSPLDRAMLARALEAIDGMNPRAIGIDIIVDQRQDEDEQLLETFRRLRTPTFLAFATARHNPEQMLPWQEAFLTDFLRAAAPGPVRPASIRLEPSLADNVIRAWPRQPPDLPPLLANAMAPIHPEFRRYTRAIGFRIPAAAGQDEVPVFTNLPIQFVAEFPEGVRSMIEGRYVLIGGDIQDLDNYDTPMTGITGRQMKGLEVHAHLLAQILDGRMPAPMPAWALWLTALGAVAAGALTALLDRGWKLALLFVFQLALGPDRERLAVVLGDFRAAQEKAWGQPVLSVDESRLNGGTPDSQAFGNDLEITVTLYAYTKRLGADPKSRVGFGRVMHQRFPRPISDSTDATRVVNPGFADQGRPNFCLYSS